VILLSRKKNKIIVFIGFTFAIACILVFYFAGSKKSIEPNYNNTPVIFIHGHGCGVKYWDTFIKYLIRSGYPENYLMKIQLKPNDGSNIEAAEKQIAPAVEHFLDSINNKLRDSYNNVGLKRKVDIISHSMGALSARWYAAKIRPERVRIWISLAGANHGTSASCGYEDPGSDDMCPAFAKSLKESYVQFQLNGMPNFPDIDETPYGIGKDKVGVKSFPPGNLRKILYITVRIKADEIIMPETSALLDGCGGINLKVPDNINATETSPGNFLVSEKINHDGIVTNKKIILFVEKVLNLNF